MLRVPELQGLRVGGDCQVPKHQIILDNLVLMFFSIVSNLYSLNPDPAKNRNPDPEDP